MRKKIYLLVFLILTVSSQSQTYIKANGITSVLLIPNIAVETSISKKYTFQLDVAASFWKSIRNRPFMLATITPEIRYHVNENQEGWYFGGHIGGGMFKLKKWNYSEYNYYQEGFNYMIGATIGYKTKISDKISLDFFLGGGNVQSFYKGYDVASGLRYDLAKGYNKSSEFIPYRGGIMIAYKLN